MKRGRLPKLLHAAAALALVAAAIHLWVTPEHMKEWWGYGSFFLVLAAAQAALALLLVRKPRRWLWIAGIVGNLAIIALWAWTRTIGIPVFGPDAGETEPAGDLDLASKLAEAGLVVILVALLRRGRASAGIRTGRPPGQVA